MILIIGKPTNIIIKKLLSSYKPIETNNKTKKTNIITEEEKKAGAFVGILERLIIIIFLYIEQFSAIGFILTAKSIARYNKITNEQEFAEYYLLGTLLSTVLVMVLEYK